MLRLNQVSATPRSSEHPRYQRIAHGERELDQGSRPADPEVLYDLVAIHVVCGDLRSARDLLDQLAGSLVVRAGSEAAAAWKLSAAICHLLGDSDGASQRLKRLAGGAAERTSDALIAAGVRLAEARLAVGDTHGALHLLEMAISPAECAVALHSYGDPMMDPDLPEGLLQPLETIVRREIPSVDVGDVVAALVDTLSGAQSEGREDLVPVLEAAALAAAAEAGDPARIAEVELLRVQRWLEGDDLTAALTAARDARRHAMKTARPLLLLQTVRAEARVLDRLGDRLGAYEVLAAGRGEIASSLGGVLADRVIEPELESLVARWGKAHFAEMQEFSEAQSRSAPTS
ncbi:hypothetical protein ACQPXM_11730 [Kribbella sp. CA-253562]|uniref:hypothetical protein n=1 Tax=Kribbella sp. CA-253562 TaxID=3239942 RepID=UPI003D91207C